MTLGLERRKGQLYAYYVKNKHNGTEYYYIDYDLISAGCEIWTNISFFQKKRPIKSVL